MSKRIYLIPYASHPSGPVLLRILAVSLILLQGFPGIASAGNPVPGRWQKVTALEQDTGVILHLQDGIRMECRFLEILDSSGNRVERDDLHFKRHGHAGGEEVRS